MKRFNFKSFGYVPERPDWSRDMWRRFGENMLNTTITGPLQIALSKLVAMPFEANQRNENYEKEMKLAKEKLRMAANQKMGQAFMATGDGKLLGQGISGLYGEDIDAYTPDYMESLAQRTGPVGGPLGMDEEEGVMSPEEVQMKMQGLNGHSNILNLSEYAGSGQDGTVPPMGHGVQDLPFPEKPALQHTDEKMDKYSTDLFDSTFPSAPEPVSFPTGKVGTELVSPFSRGYENAVKNPKIGTIDSVPKLESSKRPDALASGEAPEEKTIANKLIDLLSFKKAEEAPEEIDVEEVPIRTGEAAFKKALDSVNKPASSPAGAFKPYLPADEGRKYQESVTGVNYPKPSPGKQARMAGPEYSSQRALEALAQRGADTQQKFMSKIGDPNKGRRDTDLAIEGMRSERARLGREGDVATQAAIGARQEKEHAHETALWQSRQDAQIDLENLKGRNDRMLQNLKNIASDKVAMKNYTLEEQKHLLNLISKAAEYDASWDKTMGGGLDTLDGRSKIRKELQAKYKEMIEAVQKSGINGADKPGKQLEKKKKGRMDAASDDLSDSYSETE